MISLPIVVIEHENQTPQSWGIITWDNAFSVANRIPFFVVDSAQWQDMASALNKKFTSQTGRCLTHDELTYLGLR